jgi:acyl carrier protein phosphodiesterase
VNWLAHLYLSPPDPAFQIGNLLPDLLTPGDLQQVPLAFQGGIVCHRRIDRFTDNHPIFRQSILRLGPAWRRFGGILSDIFSDHFLAVSWSRYAAEPLPEFIDRFYGAIDELGPTLPALAHERLEQMRAGDWLRSYAELDGIHEALTRLALRFRRPVELTGAIAVLEEQYAGWETDFHGFFPELKAHVTEDWAPTEMGRARISP